MDNSTKAAYWAAVRSDLLIFAQQCFHTLYPGKEFFLNWHIEVVVHLLTESIQGRAPRLIINMPPRMLKSFLVSVVLPAYVIGRDPTAKFICVSYSDELAKTLSRDFRRIIESDWYPLVFKEVRSIKMTEHEFVTSVGGGRYATSVGGSLTGRGADFIIIDDPIKPDDAYSESARNSTNEWYKSTLLSRLDDKARSVLIIVMQRLHVNDLTGFVEAGGGFKKLALPAIATRNERIQLNEHEDHERRAGEALHEELESLETLTALCDQIGPYNFAAQYQQDPEAPDGALFKQKYIKVIDGPIQAIPGGEYWLSIDSALSTAQTADYSALSFGYSDRTGHYVLAAERGRWDFETLLAKAMSYKKRCPELKFIVEKAGSGISLLQYLQARAIPCFWSSPTTDKMTRAAVTLSIFLEGRVFLVRNRPHDAWIEPYLNELLTFPHGRFDDWVDSLVQAIRWAERRVNPGGKIYLF